MAPVLREELSGARIWALFGVSVGTGLESADRGRVDLEQAGSLCRRLLPLTDHPQNLCLLTL